MSSARLNHRRETPKPARNNYMGVQPLRVFTFIHPGAPAYFLRRLPTFSQEV